MWVWNMLWVVFVCAGGVLSACEKKNDAEPKESKIIENLIQKAQKVEYVHNGLYEQYTVRWVHERESITCRHHVSGPLRGQKTCMIHVESGGAPLSDLFYDSIVKKYRQDVAADLQRRREQLSLLDRCIVRFFSCLRV